MFTFCCSGSPQNEELDETTLKILSIYTAIWEFKKVNPYQNLI